MNHIYQLVWNARHHAWVAVAEVASGIGSRGRSGKRRKPGTAARATWHAMPQVAPEWFALKTIAACAGSICAGGLFLINTATAQTVAPNTLPQGGVVVQGAATLQGAGSASAPVLNVNQTSQRAVLNWDSFNLGSAGTVNFHQPNTQSATLNRVLDMQPSQILGRINAPGQVTLVNPAGVYFSPGAVLDVGALTATTLGQTDADFMAGRAVFSRNGATGSVVNEGTLTATDTIALLAPEVRNQGTITASAVVLAAGETIQLDFDAYSRLASIRTTPSQIAALVDNRTAVLAPGGRIILSATALAGLQASVVNSGQIDASSLVAQGGRIVLEADAIHLGPGSRLDASGATGGGTVLVGGDWQGSGSMVQARTVVMDQGASIAANATHSGDGGKVVLWSDVHNAASSTTVNGRISATGTAAGGQVETSGHSVVMDTAEVRAGGQARAGLWLIDPYNYTIASPQAATISASLGSGTSVTVDTSANVAATGSSGNSADAGNIAVNASISKTGGADTTLTLRAHNDITVAANVAISASSNKLDVVFNSDLDGNGAGAIALGTGASIASNGGNITLGGGVAGNGLGAAIGHSGQPDGIGLDGASIQAGGGHVVLHGTGHAGSTNGQDGVSLLNGSSISTTGAGTITVVGVGGAGTTSASTQNGGLRLQDSSIVGGSSGAVNVTGTGGASVGAFNYGMRISGAGSGIWSTGGAVTVVGTGGGTATSSNNIGLLIESGAVIGATGSGSVTVVGSGSQVAGGGGAGIQLWGASITSVNGPIAVTGVGSTGNAGLGVYYSSSIASSGNAAVGITTDSFDAYLGTVSAGTGTVTIQNRTAGTGIDLGGNDVLGAGPLVLGLDADELNGITAGRLVLGRNDALASGAITVSSAVAPTSAANVVLKTGADIVMQAPITVIDTLALTAAGNVSQTVGGNITAPRLLLNGAGDYALATASSNAINVLSASGTGAVSYQNNSDLQIGTVLGVNGISAAGPVSISTASGDMTVAQNVATSDSSAAALLLNAGLATAAGTSTGGNMVFSGGATASVGAGGRATLMTGSVSGSTGVTALVGSGTGRFRYNSDESTTHYSTALGSGTYAVYREAPVVTITARNASKTYDGLAYTGGNGVVVDNSGLANGDATTSTSGTAVYGGTAQGARSVAGGPYGLSVSGFHNGLGYVVGYASGSLDITPATVSVTAPTVHKTYDGTTSAPGTATVGPLAGSAAGEHVGVPATLAYTDAGVGIGNKTVRPAGLTIVDGSGLDVTANYTIQWVDNTVSSISPALAATPSVPTVLAPPVLVQEVLLPHPSVSALAPGRTVPASAVEAPGCVGTSLAGLDCTLRNPLDGYVVVTPVRNVSPALAGQVLVQVSAQVVRSGAFEAALPLQASLALRAQHAAVVAARPEGRPLPDWLQWDPQSLVLMAKAMPAGALPSTVLLQAGDERVEIEITALP